MNPRAEIPAMDPDSARGLYKFIKSRMTGKINNLTAEIRGEESFLHIEDNLAYLMPTLLELDEDHQMRTDEYPFSFGTIYRPDDYLVEELVDVKEIQPF